MSNGENQEPKEPKIVSGFRITSELQQRIDALRANHPMMTEEQAVKIFFDFDRRSNEDDRQKGAP